MDLQGDYGARRPDKKITTAGELIEALSKFPPETKVLCIGDGYECETFSPWPDEDLQPENFQLKNENGFYIMEEKVHKYTVRGPNGEPIEQERKYTAPKEITEKCIWL